jgi:hypothetical protein
LAICDELTAGKLEADVFFLDDADGGGEGCTAGEEDWLRIADAKGREALEPGGEFWVDVGEGEFGVEVELRGKEGGVEVDGGVGANAGAKVGEAGAREREADGVGVASEAVEEGVFLLSSGRSIPCLRFETWGTRLRGGVGGGVGGGDGVEEVEARDGTAGAVGAAVFRGVGDDEGGAAGAVDDAGGEDAEDAAVPVGVVEDEAVGGEGAVGVEEGGEVAVDGVEGASFGVAAGGVEGVELFGEGLGADGVAGEEEFDDVGGDVHAAGGVDAWS